jgi:ATP-binding protein involved in chromosome partitioning
MSNQNQIREALSYVIEPDLKKDLVSLNLVKEISITENNISIEVAISNPAMHNRKRVEEAILHQLNMKIGKDFPVTIKISAMPPEHLRPAHLRTVLPGVKHIIAVSSGKGGVGKSTVTSNLAVALAMKGYRVGVVDADIYGPSQPMMFDVIQEKPMLEDIEGKSWIMPVESYGVKLLSIGFFADLNQAVVWRGPMAVKALTQMFFDVYWGDLDYMLIDLPPGTGDVHLSLVQQIPLTGVVIVSTPQQVALADARKGISMFRLPSVKVPILGLIENMAYFTPAELPENKYYIFGKEGAKQLAEAENTEFLGEIPLVQSICEAGDAGRPVALQQNTPQAIAFRIAAENLMKSIEKISENQSIVNA